MRKKKPVDGHLETEFDVNGRPTGPNAKDFSNYLGSVVRHHVDINITDWPHVPHKVKEQIWHDLKNEFNLQDEELKKNILRIAGLRWKDFKTRLVRDFINKKHHKYDSPTELYAFLDEEKWNIFLENHQTEEFKAISKKYRELQARNEHPHYIGSRGYIGANDRSLDWVRARSKKSEHGSYYIPNEKTMEVFGKIIEKGEEMSQGSFQPARQNDILSAALGTNEHGGYVRGIGVHSKIRDVFGMPCRGKSSGGVSGVDLEAMEKNLYDKLADKIRRETMEEMEQKFKDMQSQLLQSFMKNAQASPRVGTPLWSSCQSVDPVNEFQEIPKAQNMRNFQSDDQYAIELQPAIVSKDVLEHLGDGSKKMVSYLRHLPANLDYVEMEVEEVLDIFHHSNKSGVVMFDDIKDLLTMQWLDVSIIQAFIM
ncbi:uncharacterized protein LOC115995988 [Ipomoea triloba]|uniref:uncharacterized protein LOC115995988 n=1 Tax=Ipomoea triloba TaxID=35885 RepID=UPI00125DA4D8|nr:uncharacterized protein LOC115995988 [Ipomoea triloba]